MHAGTTSYLTRCLPRAATAAVRAVLLASIGLLVACSAVPMRHAQPTATPPPATTIIYVVRRSWHVDIGFAAADLQPPLAALRSDFPEARFLLFGFGDRHYLLDHDRGFGGMLAALRPGAGLMLATGLSNTAQAAFGAANVIELHVTAAQALQVQQFVWHSLVTDSTESTEGAAPAPPLPGPYADSLYYPATQRYSAVHTCNTWAAQALRAGGLPIRRFGVALAGQLWVQARRLDGKE